MRDGRSRLVSVTGIAGIGKSRLAWELDRWVDAHPDDIAWHDGRALAYGEGIAFSAVAQMVRRRARIEEARRPSSPAGSSAPRSRSSSATRPNGAGSSHASPRCWPSRGGRVRARRAVRRLAPLLRARLRANPGRPGLRGPPMGRSEPARLHRAHGDLVPDPPHLHRRPRPPRTARPPPTVGRRCRQLHGVSSSNDSPTSPCASCSPTGP